MNKIRFTAKGDVVVDIAELEQAIQEAVSKVAGIGLSCEINNVNPGSYSDDFEMTFMPASECMMDDDHSPDPSKYGLIQE